MENQVLIRWIGSRMIFGIVIILLALFTSKSEAQVRVTSSGILYGDTLEQLRIEVEYHSADPDSLGDGDIWGFGYDGFATPAKLISTEIEELFPFEDDLGFGEFPPGFDPDEIGFIPGVATVNATYLIPHPSGEDAIWTEENNKRIALLLEPGQVKSRWGNQWFNPMHLGFVELRLGQEKPVITPNKVEVSISSYRKNQNALVRVELPDSKYKIASWGAPIVEEGKIIVDLIFEESLLPVAAENPVYTRSYGLPDLDPGEYEFVVLSNGVQLASEEFEVIKFEELEAKVHLEPFVDDEGASWLVGHIQFGDKYMVIEDPGKIEMVQDFVDLPGFEFLPFPTLEIKLKAVRATFVQEPDHQEFELRYRVPDLVPNTYILKFFANGSLVENFPVQWPFEREKPKSVAEIEFYEESNDYFALVMIQPARGMQIIEWGELEDNSDGGWNVNVMMERIPEGDLPGPAPEPLEKAYKLGELGPGQYPLYVTANGESIGVSEIFIGEINDPVGLPGVYLEAETIQTANTREYTFSVIYEMEEGIDEESLGDDDIYLVRFLDGEDGSTVRLASFPAKLLEYDSYDDGITIQAFYQVTFSESVIPVGAEFKFEAILNDEVVFKNDGDAVKGGRIGFVGVDTRDIEPEPEMEGQAEAGIVRLSNSNAEIGIRIESQKLIDLSSTKTGIIQVVQRDEDGAEKQIIIPKLEKILGDEEHAHHLEAVFSTGIPEGGWTTDHNGTWEISLVPNSLSFVGGQEAPGMLLGHLRVAVREDNRNEKFGVEIDNIETNSHYGIDVYIHFPPEDRRQVTSWGQPVEVDGSIEIRAKSSIRDTLDALPLKQSHRYLVVEKSSGSSGQTKVPFEIVEGPDWQILKPDEVVIQDVEEWNRWVKSQVGDLEIAFQPPVDFQESTLIGVFSGERRSGGYTVYVEDITLGNEGIVINYVETIPVIEGPVTDALTYPVQWVSIAKNNGPFKFKKSILAFPSPGGFTDGQPVPQSINAFGPPGLKLIPVTWYLDDKALAKTILSVKENGQNVGSWLDEVDSQLEVDVEEEKITIIATADFTGAGKNVQLLDWSEPVISENRVLINLNVEEKVNDVQPTPGAPPIFSEAFNFEDLKPGHYKIVLTINQSEVHSTYFLIKGNHPFLGWLEEFLSNPPDSSGNDKENVIVDPKDADGDGLSDFYEWALDSNPLDNKQDRPVASKIIEQNGKKHFQFDFNIWDDESIVQYIIEGSDNLHTWVSIESECRVVSQTQKENGSHRVSICLEKPVEEMPSKFVRIRVVNPQE